jgi:dTDP-4-amino-4,6-dideoxygalactose transaminase
VDLLQIVPALPPAAEGLGGYAGSGSACPEAEWLAERGLSLPTWVGLTRAQARRAAAELLAAVERR